MSIHYQDSTVTLHHGDCLDVLRGLPDNSVDAVVTDPPYALPGGFMGKTWDSYDGREDAGFAYWLAGLVDGEGHFAIKQHTRGSHAPMFQLSMRLDERGTLEHIRRHLGVGTISVVKHEPNDVVRWIVQDKAGCQRLVDLFDKYPLRAKKRMDYAVWREAVCEWSSRPRGNRWHGPADNSHMATLRGRLMDGRRYVDPPWSGHEFQDWSRLWAAECLRVLKPGGHMLAFGGTRTFHRLACAVEDAGFEIRDSIAWLYGSGFPKSLDVSKAIDKRRDDRSDVLRVTSLMADHAERAGISRADVDAHMGTSDMGGWWLSRLAHRCACPTPEQYLRLKALLSLPDDLDSEVMRLNGRKGTLGEAWDSREVLGERAVPIGHAFAGSTYGGDSSNTLTNITAPATDDARTWQGWGTALKPAFEPVVVGRKPLADTVAGNVLAHGTGALNIDATRISTSRDDVGSNRRGSNVCTCPSLAGDQTSRTPSRQRLASSGESHEGRSDLPSSAPEGGSRCPQSLDSRGGCPSSPCSCDERAQSAAAGALAPVPRPADAPEPLAPHAVGTRTPASQSTPCPKCTAPNVEGRWPANVVLDESQADALDEMSGERPSGGSGASITRTAPNGNGITHGAMNHVGYTDHAPDTGGASRFFYTAKASSSERIRLDGTAHPTVKPLSLMRWLVRLVTPPGGVVLEPFAGSGTTVEACILEGFRCIAIEREADYLPLITQRINRQRDPIAYTATAGEDLGLFGFGDEVPA